MFVFSLMSLAAAAPTLGSCVAGDAPATYTGGAASCPGSLVSISTGATDRLTVDLDAGGCGTSSNMWVVSDYNGAGNMTVFGGCNGVGLVCCYVSSAQDLEEVFLLGTENSDILRFRSYETGVVNNLKPLDAYQVLLGRINGKYGNDPLLVGSESDDANYSEEILGSKGDDTIYGFGGDDTLIGDGGDDTIYGGDGNDVISGGSGDDLLYGGAGDDTIDAGDDDDILQGNSGADVLIGGSGYDEHEGGLGDDVYCDSPLNFDSTCSSTVFDDAGGDGDDVLWLTYEASCSGYGLGSASSAGSGTDECGSSSWFGSVWVGCESSISTAPTECP